jgi:hypothetical protein
MYTAGNKFRINTDQSDFAEIVGVYPGGQGKKFTEYKISFAGALFVIQEEFLDRIFVELKAIDPIASVFQKIVEAPDELEESEEPKVSSPVVEDVSQEPGGEIKRGRPRKN